MVGRVKVDKKEFLRRASLQHGDTYDYESISFKGLSKKVSIACRKHGSFIQRAGHHALGQGCPTCAEENKKRPNQMCTSSFIKKARKVHGTKYTYDRVLYKNSTTHVIITCGTHGDFEQTPHGHLKGQGCPKCAGVAIYSTEEFISKSRLIHGQTYNYSKTQYTGSNSKLIVTCSTHGDFLQTPSRHLRGVGCAKCADRRKTLDSFIAEARGVHGTTYNYSETDYVSAHHKIVIICQKHGGFSQTANSHLKGTGCPKCAVSGFKSDKQAFLYFLIDTETYSRVKIGISNVPDNRLRDLKNDTPFAIERIDLFGTPPEITLQIEKFCHSQLESCNLQGFDGATEWFKFEGGKLEALREFIKSCGGVTP